MQTIQTIPSINRFLVDQDEDGDLIGSVPIVAPFRIGRREGFDLCLSSENVSGLHAEILEEDGNLWLYDLNSTNGTFINDDRVDVKAILKDGDSIVFGNRRFRVVLIDSDASSGRRPLATVPNAAPTPAPESPKQKFHRLLDSGAVPYFQPIYEIASASQRIIGYEVLGRSRIYGLNTPEQMFAAALPLEMESELSRILRQRGIEAAQNRLPDDLKLFVNTHPAELECSVLGKSLHELRKLHPNRSIVLELSESSLNDPGAFSDLRSMLRNLDIGLALHDFSAGKIHLAELNEIAPDIVKFDCALLHKINKAPLKRQRLIRAMVKMVKELGITPMAEYIESIDEHESLVRLGFEYAQGFHYGKPIDVETISVPAKTPEPSDVPKKEILTSAPAKGKTSVSNQRPVDLMKEAAKQNTASRNKQDKPTTPDASELRKSSAGHKDFKWLMQQRQDHYTIQLMMSHSQNAAESFLAKQSLSGEYALYHKRGKNTDWYVVLHGIYENRATAKPQAESFKELGVCPLIRRLSSVHTEIRKRIKEESSS